MNHIRLPVFARFQGLIFLAPFFIYLITLSPQIFWRDSAEFVATAYTLSISHPPGSPTYNLLAKLASFLPLGSIAFRINMFSALMATAVVFLIFKTLQTIFYQYMAVEREGFYNLAALLPAFLFGCSFAFWRWSVCAEVYALQILFIISMLYLTLFYCSDEKTNDYRIIFLVAVLFTLSLGVHMTNVLFLPAFAIFFVWKFGKALSIKKYLGIMFFGFLGFTVYFYLPLRFAGGAPIKFGATSNLEKIWSHITGAKVMTGENGEWEKILDSLTSLHHDIWSYLGFLQAELSFLGLLLGLIGFIYLARKLPRIALLTSLIFLANIVFFMGIWDASSGYMPSFLIYSLWIGVGVNALIILASRAHSLNQKTWIKRKAVVIIIILAIISQFLVTFLANYRENNLFNFYVTHKYANSVLDSLKYWSVLITYQAIPQFPIWYLQLVENRRNDVITMPLGNFPSDSVIDLMLVNEWNNYNFYWVGNEKTKLFFNRLVPNGLVFRIKDLKKEAEIEEEDIAAHLKYRLGLERHLNNDLYADDYESYSILFKTHYNLFYYYSLRNDFQTAREEFEQLIETNPESGLINLFFAQILAERKEFKEAAYYFARSFLLNRHIHRGRFFEKERRLMLLGAGIVMLHNNNYKKATEVFSSFLDLSPSSFLGHYCRGLSLMEDNQLDKALKELRIAQSLKPGDEEVSSYIKRVEKMVSSEGRG